MELKAKTKIKSDLRKEDIFSNKYFIFNKKMLKSVGLWPYQRTWLKRILRIGFVICVCSIMIPQLIRAIQEWNAEIINLTIMIECISGMILYFALLARLTMAIVQESKLQYIYEEITNDIEEMKDLGEQTVLQRFHNIGRILTIFYCVYCHVTISVFVWTPAVAPMIINTFLNTTLKKSICVYVEYFVDQDEYFYYIFSHTAICSIIATMLFTAFDSTFISIVQHAVGLLQVLKYRLNKLTEKFEELKYCRKDDNTMRNIIISCIVIHKKSLQFVKIIDDTYDTYHFFLYSLLLSGLSIFTIDIVVNVQDYFALMRLVPSWSAIIVYMFYFNWPGQKLIDSGNEIYSAIYFCNWYSYPLKYKKLLQFMSLRSNDPVFLKASIFTMSFETCGIILKTAMSYFTVFISLL